MLIESIYEFPYNASGFEFTVVSHCVGTYGIHIKFNDQHIPNSPFMVNVAPDSGVARQVTVHSLKDKGLEVGLQCPRHEVKCIEKFNMST